MHASIIAALFAGAVLAAPTAPPAPANTARPYPTESQDLFSLVVKLTKQRAYGEPLDVDNNIIVGAHSGAGENVAEILPAGGSVQPNIFVQNGTTQETMYSNGYVERYPGTPNGENGTPPTIVYGITVFPSVVENDGGVHSVGINAGPGSKGVAVQFPYTGVVFPEAQPKLGFTNETVRTYHSQWLACERPLYAGNITELLWRSENATTPDDCAEITIFAQCAGNATETDAAAYHTLNKTPCYTDAASIPVVSAS